MSKGLSSLLGFNTPKLKSEIYEPEPKVDLTDHLIDIGVELTSAEKPNKNPGDFVSKKKKHGDK